MAHFKSENQDLERKLSDALSKYDKDIALWEGKCQFLQNQKENYQRDLLESQRKFEIPLAITLPLLPSSFVLANWKIQ